MAAAKTNLQLTEELLSGVSAEVIRMNNKYVEWLELAKTNPFAAFDWDYNPMELVAKLYVYREIQDWLNFAINPEKSATPEGVAHRILQEARDRCTRYLSRGGSRSTSTIDNLQEEFKAKAWAEFLEHDTFYGRAKTIHKIAQDYVDKADT